VVGQDAGPRLEHRRVLGHDGVQMLQGLIHRERVHLAAAIQSTFDSSFQEVSRDLDGQRVGDHLAGAPVVLRPGRVGQRDPHRAAIDQEFNVHRVGMAGGDGHDDGLIDAVQLFARPAVLHPKILVHGKQKI